MAVEAIWAACDDAGISPREIDGLVRYDMEQVDEEQLLGVARQPAPPLLRRHVVRAAAARRPCSSSPRRRSPRASPRRSSSFARGRAASESGYGSAAVQGGRYWEKVGTELAGLNQWHVPQGLVSAFQEMAMIAMRHRIDYGTTDDQYADVAIAFREHARRNPNAVMRTADDPRRPPRVAHDLRSAPPLRLQHRDRRRCRDDRHVGRARARPAPAARDHPRRSDGGGLPPHPPLEPLRARPSRRSPRCASARAALRDGGVPAADIDVRLLLRLLHRARDHRALEQYGFAPRGEGGRVRRGRRALEWPDGRLVCNTNGGQLSEAFIHGFNNTVEAVRQIRGTSTSQVQGCDLVVRRAEATPIRPGR